MTWRSLSLGAHHRAAEGPHAFAKKKTVSKRKRLTSSQGASLIAPEDAPKSAMVSIDEFESVHTKVDEKERSKDSVAVDQS